MYYCYCVARFLINFFFKYFFPSWRYLTGLICTFGPMRSEDRTNMSLSNQSDSKCLPERYINGPARPNGKHMSVSANFNCFRKWWVQYGLSILLWRLLRTLFQLRTHIQRLNLENKQISVVIDFPVTCQLDSSHLIHFGFLCVSFKTLYSWCYYNLNYLKSGLLSGHNSWSETYQFKKGAVPAIIRVTSLRFSSFIIPHCTLVIFHRKFFF